VNDAFIYDAVRSPRTRAKPDGGLHDLRPQELLRQLYAALAARSGLSPDAVGEVILGCVTQHGEQAGNIARSSVLYSGWPERIGGLTVNRFCSSSLDAIAIAALKVDAGLEGAVVAGGVEMMSRVPLLADAAAVFTDPELARASRVLMMGSGADLIATLEGVDRTAADAVALASQQRAARARREGWFHSVVPIENTERGITVTQDECIRESLSMADLAALPAAFEEIGAGGADAVQLAAYPTLEAIDHVHTAGNSPAMCDGAAVVLIGGAALERHTGRPPRARILHAASACGEPLQVLSGCIAAARRVLGERGMDTAQVDLFEIHEAFAATMVKARRDLGIGEDRCNVNGGVIALGHPMGATGAMMAGTLLDELERRDLGTGLVAASGAAGSGCALLVERC